jgi:CheY-like chemotaxis protein
LPICEEPPVVLESSSQLAQSRILLVDNSAAEANEIVRYLQRVGLRHQLAKTQDEAVACLRDARLSDDSYDIVLVPDSMPGSLLALSQAIQTDPLNQKVALILIRNSSAAPTFPDVAECNFADTIETPLDAAKVFDALARVSMARCGQPKSVPLPAPPSSQSAKSHILIAEDNLVNQKVAQRLLEKLGYSVDVAANGREAVDKWASGSYDLILMDCQMPEMDGYEATRAIRTAESGGRHIPIVAVTANTMVGDREKCLACGMDAFVPKPIKTEILTNTISHLIASTLERT